MDKAYVDFLALYRFHNAGAYWISRPKDNMSYEVTDHSHDFDPSTGICGDFTIKLTTHKSKKLYPEQFPFIFLYCCCKNWNLLASFLSNQSAKNRIIPSIDHSIITWVISTL